ncbi:9958_t:CDS:2 [Paraglomus occultum]|uniref:9958_t:CDS:1 n=1 Tax=Paraglomus occultum TaxID=144539 RepID=A0A9N9ANC7_9GLOM|nr:9958_t:CDS:2 [Paraglomus occultum]
MSKETRTLEEKDIQPGDYVGTNFRGGTRQGYVERIATTKEEDQKPKVVRPPKVIFKDQHGHVVAHNPSTLWKDETKSERESSGIKAEQENYFKDEDYNEEEDEDYKPPPEGEEEDEDEEIKPEEIEEMKQELNINM